MKKSLFTFTCAIFCALTAFATDYTVPTGTSARSNALPIWMANNAYGSISQQVYLASELTAEGASAGNITAITFHYTYKTVSPATAAAAMSRPIKIWLMETESDSIKIDSVTNKSGTGYDGYALFQNNGINKAGTLVYTGNLETEYVDIGAPDKTVTLTLNNAFPWDGLKNIVMTVCDMSETSATISSTGLRFILIGTSKPRFAHKTWVSGDTDNRTSWIDDISQSRGEIYSSPSKPGDQVTKHKYVNKIKFSITSLTTPSTPTGLAASDISMTSASLNWNAASSATSYELQQSANGEDWSDLASSISGTSYSWTSLSASTTYFVRVRAVNAVGNSDWSDAISFMTEAPHTHNGITFEKWNDGSTIPTSGNYYLGNDVSLSGHVTLSGNLNLCLNGHTIYTETRHIIVPDEKTLAIYDNVGGGRIYGYHVANYPEYGIINVQSGGTLVMSEGSVENLYGTYIDNDPSDGDDSDDPTLSYAIWNNGTFKLSGTPTISGVTADIYLYSANVITIESGKPLTNTSPYKIYKNGSGVFTSGWNTYMSDADPRDYFVSANASYGVYLKNGEANFISNLSHDGANAISDKLSSNNGQLVNFTLSNRTITSAQYNTLCLPFALDNAQLEEVFGSGYNLQEFTSSSIEGEVLNLEFNKVTSLIAGKPYLIQPSANAINPTFEGVTIDDDSDDNNREQTSDTYISFHGIFTPTSLEGGNKNLLFLGANNELLWPEATANLNGFRAYFEKKGAALSAIHARIVQKEDAATGINQITNDQLPMTNKFLRNGELLILRDGRTYNTLGQRVK